MREGRLCTSTIDLILCNSLMLELRPRTTVLRDTNTSSDHKMIEIEIEFNSNNTENTFNSTTRKFRMNKANWQEFNVCLDKYEYIMNDTNFNVSNKAEADLAIENINEYLNKA